MNRVQFDIAVSELDPTYRIVLFALRSKFYHYLDALKRNLGSGSYYGYVAILDVHKGVNGELTRHQVYHRLKKLEEKGLIQSHMREGHVAKNRLGYRPSYIKDGFVEQDPNKPYNLILK